MPWTLQSDRPIYLQLMEEIQQRILSGVYPAGAKLPSVRDLAAEASVNPNTMQKALVELERMDLVTTNRTSGRQITEDGKMLEKMKRDLVLEKFREFIKHLRQIGFQNEEIPTFIADTLTGELQLEDAKTKNKEGGKP